MAVIGRRILWTEPITEVIPVSTPSGISGNSLNIPFDDIGPIAGVETVHLMEIAEPIADLFTEIEAELIWSSNMIIDPASRGIFMLGLIRTQWSDKTTNPEYAFVGGIGITPDGSAVIFLARFNGSGIELLFFNFFNIDDVVRFRLRSNDEGANVKVQFEIQNLDTSDWAILYIAELDDMPSVNGTMGGISLWTMYTDEFLGPPSVQISTPGDYGLLDDIQVSQNVIDPLPTLPFSDGFEDDSWEL